MEDIKFEICTKEADALEAFRLAMKVAGERGVPFLDLKRFLRSFEDKRLIIGRDGNKVVALRAFNQVEDKIVGSFVSIHKEYRNRGLSKALREFAVKIWKSRGATHEEVKLLQSLEWMNRSVVNRGAILLGSQRIRGVMYNVYHWEWEPTGKLPETVREFSERSSEPERSLDIIGRGYDSDFGWSIKRVPLVPGYWCVCVGPLKEEWGDYAGKIFLARANISFSPGGDV